MKQSYFFIIPLFVLNLLLGFCHDLDITTIHTFPIDPSSFVSLKTDSNVQENHKYETHFLDVLIDHFTFKSERKFPLRYLLARQFWNKNGGPIFIYTGNEGDITSFSNNTGFMWDIAPEFGAMLLFIEHRYYGVSQPFGKSSFNTKHQFGYLTAEQALADFVTVIKHVKQNIKGATQSPVIAFGGSYGGMLAAWIRLKYPNVVIGSIAASAPIWWFGNATKCGAYSQICTNDFNMYNLNCVKNIRKSWEVINRFSKTVVGLKQLTSVFKLCSPLKGASDLKSWLNTAWTSLPMVNYPYSTSFLTPLPPWPIKKVCSFLSSGDVSEVDLLINLRKAAGIYYNYTGDAGSCFNLSASATPSLGLQGWNIQSCSEMVMPMCSNGITDMFEPAPWNYNSFRQNCIKQYNLYPRPNWIFTEFWGKHLKAASNIVFSNGLLDPWHAGGVLVNQSASVRAVIIPEGAHHLDLRSSNPADPQSVIQARQTHRFYIKKWIKES